MVVSGLAGVFTDLYSVVRHSCESVAKETENRISLPSFLLLQTPAWTSSSHAAVRIVCLADGNDLLSPTSSDGEADLSSDDGGDIEVSSKHL